MDQLDPTLLTVRVRRARELGLTPGNLRGMLYEHPLHGVVRPAYVGLDPTIARVADAISLMGDSNALGGWAALMVQGNTWFDGLDRSGDARDVLVHCRPGSQLRVRTGVRPTEGDVLADETISLGPYEVATLARAVYDEMRLARGVREAVVALDMALSTTSGVAHTTLAAVRRVVDSHHKTRGIVQARKAVELASSRSASPWESRTRMLAELDAGVTGLLVNAPVFDLAGSLLGIVDLIDPATGLVIESDGADHRTEERHTDDNRREERLERARLVVCRVTAADHAERWATVGRINRARVDAARERERLWTLDQPAWWDSWKHAPRWA